MTRPECPENDHATTDPGPSGARRDYGPQGCAGVTSLVMALAMAVAAAVGVVSW